MTIDLLFKNTNKTNNREQKIEIVVAREAPEIPNLNTNIKIGSKIMFMITDKNIAIAPNCISPSPWRIPISVCMSKRKAIPGIK